MSDARAAPTPAGHPPLVRWLVMPGVLTLAGAGAGVLGAFLGGPFGRDWRYCAMLAAEGAGLGLGSAIALASVKSLGMRCLATPLSVGFAWAGFAALAEAHRTGGAADPSASLLVLAEWRLPWVLLPAPVLVFCHHRFESLGTARAAFLRAAIAYPLLLTLAAFTAYLLSDRRIQGGAVWLYSFLGAGQALGMEAVRRISAALRRRA